VPYGLVIKERYGQSVWFVKGEMDMVILRSLVEFLNSDNIV